MSTMYDKPEYYLQIEQDGQRFAVSVGGGTNGGMQETRHGSAGTSQEAARGDHSHPYPVFVATQGGTELRFWADTESELPVTRNSDTLYIVLEND